MVISGNGKLHEWSANGMLATVAWFIMLVAYITLRAFGIEDPLLGQAFLLLTGAWVGNLTIAQGRKTAEIEEKADRAEKIATHLENTVADRAEVDDGEAPKTELEGERDGEGPKGGKP